MLESSVTSSDASSAAGDNEHALGFSEQLGRTVHCVLVESRLPRRQGRHNRCNAGALAPDVDGAFERGRARPAFAHRADCLGDLG
jgi:hypothetical protein